MTKRLIVALLVPLALGTGCGGKTCTVDDDDDDSGTDDLSEACYDAGYYDFQDGSEYDADAAGCSDYEDYYDAGWCQATEDEGLFDPEC